MDTGRSSFCEGRQLQGKGRKTFFFEKKEQKTFATSANGVIAGNTIDAL
jgi:hypothetical protein